MTDIVSLGEPMVEFCATDVGSLRDVKLFKRGWGGDTSNFVISAARLGGKAGYICKIGDDGFGESFLNLWRSENVDSSQVMIEKGNYTAVYFISLLPKGQHDFTYFRENSAASHYSPSDLNVGYLKKAKLFHSSGITLALSRSCREAVFRGAEIIKQSGGLFSFDVNYRPGLWPQNVARSCIEKAMEKADLIFASKEDVKALYQQEISEYIGRIYSIAKPKLLVLKLGSEGCLLASQEETTRIPGFDVTVVDTTGAGDAFDGAFDLGFLGGWSPEKSAIFANATGALTTMGFGAVDPIPTRKEVEDFLRSRGGDVNKS